MKSAFITDIKKVELRESADPICPEDGLVLEVKACGICGSDIRRWKEGPGAELVVGGHEVSGVVETVGSNLIDYKVGDRLALAPDIHCGKCYFCKHGQYNLCDDLHLIGITPGYDGGLTEKMVLTSEMLKNGIVHRMPDDIGFDEAALAEPCSSVLSAHDHAGTDLGQTVLVMGGGPIGCLHIAVAQARGAQVILSEPSEVRQEIAKSFQPIAIVDPISDDLSARVKEITGGVGVDIVVCANPVAATQTQAVQVVRKGGRVILFGGLPKANPMTTFDGNRIHYGEIEVVGSFSYHPKYHQMALDVIRQGLIPTEKMITHRFQLLAIGKAFEAASSGEALKVIITN